MANHGKGLSVEKAASFRVFRDVVARVERLAEDIGQETGVRPSIGDLLRLAVDRGVAMLEAERDQRRNRSQQPARAA